MQLEERRLAVKVYMLRVCVCVYSQYALLDKGPPLLRRVRLRD